MLVCPGLQQSMDCSVTSAGIVHKHDSSSMHRAFRQAASAQARVPAVVLVLKQLQVQPKAGTDATYPELNKATAHRHM